LVRQLYIRLFQRAAETAHAVAVLAYILAFRFVQDVPDVRAAVAAGRHKSDEILDELFEENIVFPQRVVCINQQCVAFHKLRGSACFAIPQSMRISSVTAPARLRRSRALRQGGPWPAPLVSSRGAFPAGLRAPRFSTPPREDCCSGSRRRLRANDRRCAPPGQGSARREPSATRVPGLPKWSSPRPCRSADPQRPCIDPSRL